MEREEQIQSFKLVGHRARSDNLIADKTSVPGSLFKFNSTLFNSTLQNEKITIIKSEMHSFAQSNTVWTVSDGKTDKFENINITIYHRFTRFKISNEFLTVMVYKWFFFRQN